MKIQLMQFNVSNKDGNVYSKNSVSFSEFMSVYEKKIVENQEILDRIGDAQITSDETGLYANIVFIVDYWKNRKDVSFSIQSISSRNNNAASCSVTGIVAS